MRLPAINAALNLSSVQYLKPMMHYNWSHKETNQSELLVMVNSLCDHLLSNVLCLANGRSYTSVRHRCPQRTCDSCQAAAVIATNIIDMLICRQVFVCLRMHLLLCNSFCSVIHGFQNYGWLIATISVSLICVAIVCTFAWKKCSIKWFAIWCA